MSGGSFNKKTVQVKETHNNVQQEVINITEDKLRLHINAHKNSFEDRKAWISPLSLLVTLIIVLTTSTFDEKSFGLDAAEWKAVFVISALLTLLWLINTIVKFIKSNTIDDLVNEIKTNHNPK